VIWRLTIPFMMMAQAAFAQDYVFNWQGAGGYSMQGAVSFRTGDAKGVQTQDDVQCFEIEGFLDGTSVGRWALSMLIEETMWLLEFDPTTSSFVLPHATNSMPQAWNMTGLGDGCGLGGFGFNLGSAAQDICINDELIRESQVPPPTPLVAAQVEGHRFSDDACIGSVVVSRQMR